MLLVHGIYAGSSSYEFRELFPILAERYHVVAMDLLGCGLSDRPNIPYSAELFTAQIVDALAMLGPHTACLVGSSMGAAFSTLAAAHVGRAIGSLALISPTGMCGTLDTPPTPITSGLRKFVLSPITGPPFWAMLSSHPSLRFFLQNQGYAHPSSATPEIIEDYYVATHQPGSRYVPAHFVGGALNCSIAAALPLVQAPVMIAWGTYASGTSPITNAEHYVAAARDARLETFTNSKLLPHEEEPALFAQRLDDFIASASSSA